MTEPEQLHGSWLLTRWDYTVDGAFRGFPMGEDAKGQIMYAADGNMSAILMHNNRPRSQASQFHQATAAEREIAALGYVSYGGTWVLSDDTVTQVPPIDAPCVPQNWDQSTDHPPPLRR